MTTFKELGLNPELVKSLDDLGFVEPTPVQREAIPFVLKSKKDLIALAQTGTGKTAAFGLPILNKINAGKNNLEAIILCPTRELCLQISEDIRKFARNTKDIAITSVYGGASIDIQIRSLRRRTHIVVGTPGRVRDLIKRNVLKLQSIKWVVLDEADEMLDMGFKDDLDAILNETPESKRTLLFSATMSASVSAIAKNYMREAEEISIGEKNIGAENVSHEYYVVQARDRFEALKRILDFLPGVYGILFCRTRIETQLVADKLKQANYDTEALHGDISQNQRTKIMDRFKKKHVRLLVATDVAARGIDVSNLSHVINYNLPDQDGSYTHRTGRTGRAEKSGVAISILTPRDATRVRALENLIGKKFELKKVPNKKEICSKQIDNFLKEIEETALGEAGNEVHFEEATQRLKKINKEDLIKLIITHKFNRILDTYKNARDLNANAMTVGASRGGGKRAGSTGGVDLKINFGKKNGLDAKKLFGMLNSNKQLKGTEVGRIKLMPEYTIFTVGKNSAEKVVKNLKGTNFKGKKIVINISNLAMSYGGDRQGGGYGNKRKYAGKRR